MCMRIMYYRRSLTPQFMVLREKCFMYRPNCHLIFGQVATLDGTICSTKPEFEDCKVSPCPKHTVCNAFEVGVGRPAVADHLHRHVSNTTPEPYYNLLSLPFVSPCFGSSVHDAWIVQLHSLHWRFCIPVPTMCLYCAMRHVRAERYKRYHGTARLQCYGRGRQSQAENLEVGRHNTFGTSPVFFSSNTSLSMPPYFPFQPPGHVNHRQRP